VAADRGRSADVIVVGLGGMGSAAVAELARRKVRALGFERHQPPHHFGSSHGRSRRIGQVYPEDPAYVPLLFRAYERWRELEALASVSLLYETGGLMIGSDQSHVVSRGLESAERWGIEHEVLRADEVTKRWPTLTPAAGDVALFERRAGFVRPEATVDAHIRLAREAGAELHFGEEVLGWDVTASGVEVETPSRRYRAERLVLAPGAWSGPLMERFGIPFHVERHVQFWFEPSVPIERFAPTRQGVYVWEGEDGTQAYGFPVTGDRSEGVKAAFSHSGTPAEPDRLERTVDPGEAQRLLEFLAHRVPGLGPAVLDAVPCMYTVTPDSHFVLGLAPGDPRIVLCSPCSGHGFKFVPVVGEIVADLVQHGHSTLDIALFDPGRFGTAPLRR
jgi:sarcosine oxidase